MKRGSHFKPTQSVSCDAGEVMRDIAGIRFEYSEFHPGIADARGFWWNKRIVTGPRAMMMDAVTRRAIMAHEAKHCISYHLEKRILLIVLVAAPLLLLPAIFIIVASLMGLLAYIANEAAEQQELDADTFAAEQGYGRELLAFLKKLGPTEKGFYPDFERRCENLEQRIREKELRGEQA